MYFLVVREKFTANVVVGLLGNESPDSNRFTLVTPKPENGVRLQATLGNQNPTGLPVRAVRCAVFPLQILGIVRQLVAEKCFRSKTYRESDAGYDLQW